MDVRSLMVLSRVPGIGLRRVRALVEQCGDAAAVLEALDAAAQEGSDRMEVRVYADSCAAARSHRRAWPTRE